MSAQTRPCQRSSSLAREDADKTWLSEFRGGRIERDGDTFDAIRRVAFVDKVGGDAMVKWQRCYHVEAGRIEQGIHVTSRKEGDVADPIRLAWICSPPCWYRVFERHLHKDVSAGFEAAAPRLQCVTGAGQMLEHHRAHNQIDA